MNYLLYIEHSAENLQFYLWYQDYRNRFEQLPASEKALAPAWSQATAEAEAAGQAATNRPAKKINREFAEAFKGTDFADGQPKGTTENGDPFTTPKKTPSLEKERDVMSD